MIMTIFEMPLFRRATTNNSNKKNEGEACDGYVELGSSTSAAAITTPSLSNNHRQHHHKPNRFREQFHSFRDMASPYFHENPNGRFLLLIMVILTLSNSAVRVLFSYLARDFWSALYDQNVEKFYNIMAKFVGAMILLAPINVAYRFQRQKLAIAWRKWLTGRVLRLYFSNKVYYGLERQAVENSAVDTKSEEYDHMGDDENATTTKKSTTTSNAQTIINEVDNPDQRISEDIRSFTEFSLYFFLTLITSVIDLICFSFILFSIMPQLFLAIFLFAFIGTFLTVCIGKVLIRLNYESLQREADFRFSLVRVRENSESIAFYAGENVEERETDRRFEHVIANMTMINVSLLPLSSLQLLRSHSLSSPFALGMERLLNEI
jgi:putative ATP-binding cassette transporter